LWQVHQLLQMQVWRRRSSIWWAYYLIVVGYFNVGSGALKFSFFLEFLESDHVDKIRPTLTTRIQRYGWKFPPQKKSTTRSNAALFWGLYRNKPVGLWARELPFHFSWKICFGLLPGRPLNHGMNKKRSYPNVLSIFGKRPQNRDFPFGSAE
jgi:hypothetical protein